MSPPSKNYDTSPERPRFHRLKPGKHTSSERAASSSSSASSSSVDEPGGARLDQSNPSDSPEQGWTPVRSRKSASRATKSSPAYVVTTPDDEDDVFLSPGRVLKERSSERFMTLADNQTVNAGMAADESGLRAQNHQHQASSRHEINGVDAQNLYPPSACVFVANLPEPKDDMALEAAIYREFLHYGKCWVKIRRDPCHMPFAFVQYTTDAEARLALEHGKGAQILGRACRTEPVKANRTYVIQRKDGQAITTGEAQRALQPYGSLAKCEHLHAQLREPLNYPPTVLVEFAMFDANRDLQSVFRTDPMYTVMAFDLKRTCAVNRMSTDEAYLAACERDRRSIFIGDLAAGVSQESLHELFSEAGEILKINILQRSVPVNYSSTSVLRTMAFIEYTQPDMPELAIAKLSGQSFMGSIMRVERKTVKDRGPRHSRSHNSLGHKASEESVGRNQMRATPLRQSHAPPDRAFSTPRHPHSSNRGNHIGIAPSHMPPPAFNIGYAAVPTNHTGGNNFSYGGGPAGPSGGFVPMTPQGPPQMGPPLPSPWTYYYNNWSGFMPNGDPTQLVTPFSMQSHAHLGNSVSRESFEFARSGGRYSGARTATAHHRGGIQETPTRGGSHHTHKEAEAD